MAKSFAWSAWISMLPTYSAAWLITYFARRSLEEFLPNQPLPAATMWMLEYSWLLLALPINVLAVLVVSHFWRRAEHYWGFYGCGILIISSFVFSFVALGIAAAWIPLKR